jgi:hypothetical protein
VRTRTSVEKALIVNVRLADRSRYFFFAEADADAFALADADGIADAEADADTGADAVAIAELDAGADALGVALADAFVDDDGPGPPVLSSHATTRGPSATKNERMTIERMVVCFPFRGDDDSKSGDRASAPSPSRTQS